MVGSNYLEVVLPVTLSDYYWLTVPYVQSGISQWKSRNKINGTQHLNLNQISLISILSIVTYVELSGVPLRNKEQKRILRTRWSNFVRNGFCGNSWQRTVPENTFQGLFCRFHEKKRNLMNVNRNKIHIGRVLGSEKNISGFSCQSRRWLTVGYSLSERGI